ncbi:MAG: acetyltransferase [Deltaproteobacteria bacterium]|nr:MAG: acetyltransferase [Deltaproteobacteria bacterium]PIE72956.1 MAG: acetyltransferase [Deltaproteobacteria bacterium]
MKEQASEKKARVEKQNLAEQLHSEDSSLSRYRNKVLGKKASLVQLLGFELGQIICSNLGGGLGYLLRKLSFSPFFRSCGTGLILGRGITLRTPGNIDLGENVAIDDQTLLDGGTGPECTMSIGDRSLISKGCVIQAKTGFLVIGKECDIGAHVILTSTGGLTLEDNVLIAGNCYIGGARYNLDELEQPIMHQGIYSRGAITIGKNSWLGASVTILDGVKIGRGCVIGAGSVVTKDIPDYAIAVGSPARVRGSRLEQESRSQDQ